MTGFDAVCGSAVGVLTLSGQAHLSHQKLVSSGSTNKPGGSFGESLFVCSYVRKACQREQIAFVRLFVRNCGRSQGFVRLFVCSQLFILSNHHRQQDFVRMFARGERQRREKDALRSLFYCEEQELEPLAPKKCFL